MNVTYYGPELAPTALLIRATDETTGLVSLSRPDSEEIIVTDVPLVTVPTPGCAIPVNPVTPVNPVSDPEAPKPKKPKRSPVSPNPKPNSLN